MNYLISDKAVCRIAPATRGLLNILCTILSIRILFVNKIGVGTLGGLPRGPGAKGLNQ